MLEPGAVVRVERDAESAVTKVVVEGGAVKMTNVGYPRDEPVVTGSDVSWLAPVEIRGTFYKIRLLAPDVTLADTKQRDKFGVVGAAIVLKPGVKVEATYVTQYFNPAVFNAEHQKYIARSEKAQPMAVNMYSAFWTLVVCVLVAVGVSLVTKPKPGSQLKNLVMGLTPRPDEGPCPWYEHPAIWATAVLIVLVAVNILFW